MTRSTDKNFSPPGTAETPAPRHDMARPLAETPAENARPGVTPGTPAQCEKDIFPGVVLFKLPAAARSPTVSQQHTVL